MKKIILLWGVSMMMLLSISATSQEKNLDAEASNAFADNYGTTVGSVDKDLNTALVYIDFEYQEGKTLQALANLGYTVTVASGWNDFNNKLGSNDYGLVVFFNQGHTLGASLTAVTNYINNGGSAVFTDWTRNASFASLFQIQFTNNNNETLMHLDPRIEGNVSNPMTLTNTGWTQIFSTGLAPTGDGEILATFDMSGDAAIVRANEGRTIVLGYLSDVPPAADRQQLFENLFIAVTVPDPTPDPAPAPDPEPVPLPLSNLALILGMLLIVVFTTLKMRNTL